MSLKSRDGSFHVDRGDEIDKALTFFAVSTVVFVVIGIYIVVNPYFDWKDYGEALYIAPSQKGIQRSDEIVESREEVGFAKRKNRQPVD